MQTSPALQAFMTRWDNGAGWLDFSVEGNGSIDANEVKKGGGARAMVADYAKLSSGDQHRVIQSLKDDDARRAFERALDPQAAAVFERFDKNRDWEISSREAQASGLAAAFGGLGEAAQRRFVASMDPEALHGTTGAALARSMPALFDPKDFGRARFTSAADQRTAAQARKLMAESLGIDPMSITEGLTTEHLTHLPTHAVPSTSAEAFIGQLRAALDGQEPMDILAFGRFMKAHPLEVPTVEADALAEAIAQNPSRFEGKRIKVKGFADEVSRRRYTTMTWGPKYDILDGEMKFGWKTAQVMEVKHRLHTDRSKQGPGVLVYEKDFASSFFTVGWWSTSSARTKQLDNREWVVDGTLRQTRDGMRLDLRNVKTKG